MQGFLGVILGGMFLTFALAFVSSILYRGYLKLSPSGRRFALHRLDAPFTAHGRRHSLGLLFSGAHRELGDAVFSFLTWFDRLALIALVLTWAGGFVGLFLLARHG